jgi:hypothetical protein
MVAHESGAAWPSDLEVAGRLLALLVLIQTPLCLTLR